MLCLVFFRDPLRGDKQGDKGERDKEVKKKEAITKRET